MNKTKIEWCDMTFNPVTGCLHGCEYCYARKIAQRFGGHAETGERHVIVSRESAAHKAVPFPFGFDPTFYHYRLKEPQTIKKPQTIFVCSMADLFGEWVPDEWIERVFQACEKAPWHRYLFLTKNPYRYTQLLMTGKLAIGEHIWLGTTLTRKGKTPFNALDSKQNFISAEPLLEPVSDRFPYTNVQWVIVGAETGNRKGKVVPQRAWVYKLVTACHDAGTPVFMKNSLRPIWGEELIREFPWDVVREGTIKV